MSDCETVWADEDQVGTAWTDPTCIPQPDEYIAWTFTDGVTEWTFTDGTTPWTLV